MNSWMRILELAERFERTTPLTTLQIEQHLCHPKKPAMPRLSSIFREET